MKFPNDSEVICIEGWSEALYAQALKWVNDERRVVFVTEREVKSEDLRVLIYSPDSLGVFARKAGWLAVQKKLHVIGTPSFQEEVEKCHLGADLILSEAAHLHVLMMKNGRANDFPYRRGMALAGAFRGCPALIVGAGPSLEKNGDLIKEFEEKGLIFAGGSALNVINVEPHFAGSIDAEAPHEQFKKHPFSNTPFCYQSRMNPDNLSLVKGERLLFPDSSCEALNWIYGEELFNGGWTVGNFMTAVAALLGCSPIFFIGMDLCYEGNRKYAKIDAKAGNGLVLCGDVWTQRDWLMAAKWTEEFSVGRKLFNAGVGGILNLPRVDLRQELLLLPKQANLREKVAGAIQKTPVKRTSRWKEWDENRDGIVEEKLLLPLWASWRHLFERELTLQDMEIHKQLFFQRVLREHALS
jgi:hypothetical protein